LRRANRPGHRLERLADPRGRPDRNTLAAVNPPPPPFDPTTEVFPGGPHPGAVAQVQAEEDEVDFLLLLRR
jgi:hypothetical protein